MFPDHSLVEYRLGRLCCTHFEEIGTYGCSTASENMVPFSSLVIVTPVDTYLGNMIRVEPNTVVFRSPKASHDIYGSKANVSRAPFYDALRRREEERNTLSRRQLYGEAH